MISRVPVVTTHTGGSHLYFQNAVNINSKFNTVFVIGDTTNCKTFDKNKNVYHIDFGSLITDNLITFRQHFESFSPNPPDFEFKCFERFFLIREFMIKYNFNKVFYVDSDCIMLQNVDTLIQATPELE